MIEKEYESSDFEGKKCRDREFQGQECQNCSNWAPSWAEQVNEFRNAANVI